MADKTALILAAAEKIKDSNLRTIFYSLLDGDVTMAMRKIEIIDQTKLASWWHIDDVRCQDEGENDLTEDDCREILAIVDRTHDACIGINWDSIQAAIDWYVEDRG